MTTLTTTRIVRDVLTLSATDRASTVLLDAALHVLRTKSATFDAIRQVAVAVGSDRAKHDFNLILRKMFADGVINWGRIVVMFALAIDVQYSRAIDLQLETALFVEANLSEWLVDQGGWDAVIPSLIFCCRRRHWPLLLQVLLSSSPSQLSSLRSSPLCYYKQYNHVT